MIDYCRWVEGGTDPQTGMECWPFVRHCFEKMGVILEDNVHEAAKHFHAVPAGEAIQPMDVVYISQNAFGERHVGIMKEKNWMFHCSAAQNGVAEAELTRSYWKEMKKQYFRLAIFDYENLTH